MDFAYSDMHNEIKNLALQIIGDMTTPERLKGLEKQGPYLDRELWSKLADAGIHTACLPETLGGMGMDFLAATLVSEAIGQGCAQVPFIPCVVTTVLPLLAVDHPAAQAAVKAFALEGRLLATATIEPGNENPLAPRTTATQVGSDWQLNGTKHCVPYAADSTQVLVGAMASQQFWVGLVDTTASGLVITPQINTCGELQYQLDFSNTPATCLATGAAATALMQQAVSNAIVAYCSQAVGVADKMTRIAATYTSQREQFGVPIATFQSVAHRLANAYIDTECLKIITLKAASDLVQGQHDSETVAMAKIMAADVLHRNSQTAQHVHGGMGIDRDYHLFRYCLWAKQLEVVLGNGRMHLATLADRIAARYLANRAA